MNMMKTNSILSLAGLVAVSRTDFQPFLNGSNLPAGAHWQVLMARTSRGSAVDIR